MNRFIPAVVIVVALVAAFFFSRPAASPNLASSPTAPTFPSRTISGKAFAPQEVGNLNVALLVAGVTVADSRVKDNQYSLKLPEQLPIDLESLKNTQLVHGEGRLPDTVLGADTKLVMFDDQNNNSTLDSGEPQLEATFFVPGKDPNLRAYFQYKILLLEKPFTYNTTVDTSSGTKGYYRYALPMQSGWNMLEGELTGGYDIRLRSENTWDVYADLPKGGKGTPPGFTPQ